MNFSILECKECSGRLKKGVTKYGLKLREKWIQHLKKHPELWNEYNPEDGSHNSKSFNPNQ